MAAVLGRTFHYEWLQAISPLGDQLLRQDLLRLVDAELLFQRGVPPDASYTFKHALIKDAAYQALLTPARQHYHARIAQALASGSRISPRRSPSSWRITTPRPAWSNRRSRTGRSRPARRATVRPCRGRRAFRPRARARPYAARQRRPYAAGTRLARRPGLRPDGHDGLGRAGGRRRVHAGSSSLRKGRSEPPAVRRPAGTCSSTTWCDRTHVRVRKSERLVAVAAELNDPPLKMEAALRMGISVVRDGVARRGAPASGIPVSTETAPGEPRPPMLYGQDRGVVAQCHWSWVWWLTGFPDRALAEARGALTVALALNHPFSVAWARCMSRSCTPCAARPRPPRNRLTRSRLSATEQAFSYRLAQAEILRGWSQAVPHRRCGSHRTHSYGERADPGDRRGSLSAVLRDALRRRLPLSSRLAAGIAVIDDALGLVETTASASSRPSSIACAES